MIDPKEIEILDNALRTLAEGWSELPAFESDLDWAAIAAVVEQAAERMQDNYPYAHPLYAGQMLKPPHPVARLAYALSLWVNPNNHALDGGRASSALEKLVIPKIAGMWGWDECLGHLTGGGTMANLEALWVAAKLHPGRKVVASSQAHYTHSRLTEVLGIPYAAVDVTQSGHMDIDHLESLLAEGDVGTVVATMGTTGLGAVDPLQEILALRERHDFRIHADAAYGGYFGLSSLLGDSPRAAFDCLGSVDSVVIDPHKHGLQPYGCGSVLFRDPSVGRYYQHGSPYTYFSSSELHLGEISLECSRPGAAAVALWATMELLPLERGGAFAAMLDRCIDAARLFGKLLADSDHYVPVHAPHLDIVVYAARASSATDSSARARAIFDRAASQDVHLALMSLPVAMVQPAMPELVHDAESVTCLRSTFMKPEQLDWIPELITRLESVATSG
jgi:glutamate/tyrosine decarboxylase-like PLP-dependent enzyme